MKVPISALVAGTFLLLAASVCAQETGVSHPEALNDTINVTPTAPSSATVIVQPSSAPAAVTVITPAAPVSGLRVHTAAPPTESAVVATRPLIAGPRPDPADSEIVTTRPYYENALSEGSLMRVRLEAPLSTATTVPGSRFTSQLSAPVEHNGRVVFPSGSVVSGHVTSVHGGKRIRGAASIHLEPQMVTLPDGTTFRLSARVVDVNMSSSTRVNDEGTIVGSDHVKGTLAALSLTTGSAAVAGAMLAGAPGAAVGAAVGAGAGTIWWLKRDRQQSLPEGTELVLSLTRPLELTPLSK